MSTPLWVTELAQSFWILAGSEEPFPRNLRAAVAQALPLTVVFLPKLDAAAIEGWLEKQHILCQLQSANRGLCACLVARYGQGIVFINASDPEDEQRFSLAHEVAHFLKDYRELRQRVSHRLGEEVLEVLDGVRPARADERVHALLAKVPMGFHVHFMDRDPNVGGMTSAVRAAENSADMLAFELLAPSERVLQQVQPFLTPERYIQTNGILQQVYGLPSGPAHAYASLLAPQATKPTSFLSRLGLKD